MGVATFGTLREGNEGILMYGGHRGGSSREGGGVCPALLFSLLVLFATGFKQLAMGQKGPVGKLGLVLELD